MCGRLRTVWSGIIGNLLVFAVPSGMMAAELPRDSFQRLNAEGYRDREDAQAELLGWARRHPAEALDELFRQSRTAEDPEVRERCLGVLRELVNDEYSREGEGFIGISMRNEVAMVPGDPKPRGVIRVVHVVPDSAADCAGLRINDLIVGLNDLVWREEQPSLPFRQIFMSVFEL